MQRKQTKRENTFVPLGLFPILVCAASFHVLFLHMYLRTLYKETKSGNSNFY